jgi:hypothetical protein
MTRLMEDGEVYTDEAMMDVFDLDSYALEVGALASSIEAARKLYAEGVEPSLVEGAHCRWCPCFSRCPAKVALVQSPPSVEITPDGAARAYERLRLYRAALDKAEEILRDYARANPIPLPDGMVYGVRIDNTKSIDGRVAAQTLREKLGDAAEQAIEISVTQAGIKRVIKGTALRFDDVLAAIKARGGLRETQAPKLVAQAEGRMTSIPACAARLRRVREFTRRRATRTPSGSCPTACTARASTSLRGRTGRRAERSATKRPGSSARA